MVVVLKNNKRSVLRQLLASSDTLVVVSDSTIFPTLAVGEYFYLTILRSDGASEIVKVLSVSGASLTVVRAQEGTAAREFPAGSGVEMRVTAASVLEAAADAVDALTLGDLGITATAAELNILDGVTATTPTLNASVSNSTQTRDTVAALLADTTLTYTAGQIGTVTAGGYVRTRSEGFSYQVAASGASDHHVTTAGGVKLYVLPSDGAVNLAAFGVTTATASITPTIALAATVAKRIIIPRETSPWNMTTTLTISGVHLDFEPGARISFNMTTRAMDLTACRLTNASFTSPYSGALVGPGASTTHVSFAREVRLNSDCVVEGYYHEHASAGLNVTSGNNISIRDASFSNIRHEKGWGAAIHVSGQSSYNIRVSGVKIINADRGCEVEDGARDVWMENGYQENVFPNGYSGQPVDYANYTFVLDAHSHDGNGACINVVYRNWLLNNCGGGVTFIRSNGVLGTDHPRNCLAENIRLRGRGMVTGYETIAVQGYNNVVRGLYFEQGAGITSSFRIRVFGGTSEGNVIEDVRADTFALPFVTVDDGALGTKIANFRTSNSALSGSGQIFNISGRYTQIEDCNIFMVNATTGYIFVAATADYSRVQDFNYSISAGETFAGVITIDGAEHVQITNVIGSNYATTPPVDIVITGAARHTNIQGCNVDRGSGTSISLGASSSRNLVTGNHLSTSLATISDSGSDNRVIHNNRGNVFA